MLVVLCWWCQTLHKTSDVSDAGGAEPPWLDVLSMYNTPDGAGAAGGAGGVGGAGGAVVLLSYPQKRGMSVVLKGPPRSISGKKSVGKDPPRSKRIVTLTFQMPRWNNMSWLENLVRLQ